jgi:hypothetical protein
VLFYEHKKAVPRNARYYDSDTGRFIMHFACLPSMAAKCFATSCLSPDPTVPDISNTQMYNRYMFVGGNPISFVDLNGYEQDTAGTSNVVDDIVNAVSDAISSVGDAISSTASAASDVISKVGEGVGNAISAASNAITQPKNNSPNTQQVKGPIEKHNPRTMYNGLWDMLEGGGATGGGGGGYIDPIILLGAIVAPLTAKKKKTDSDDEESKDQYRVLFQVQVGSEYITDSVNYVSDKPMTVEQGVEALLQMQSQLPKKYKKDQQLQKGFDQAKRALQTLPQYRGATPHSWGGGSRSFPSSSGLNPRVDISIFKGRNFQQ